MVHELCRNEIFLRLGNVYRFPAASEAEKTNQKFFYPKEGLAHLHPVPHLHVYLSVLYNSNIRKVTKKRRPYGRKALLGSSRIGPQTHHDYFSKTLTSESKNIIISPSIQPSIHPALYTQIQPYICLMAYLHTSRLYIPPLHSTSISRLHISHTYVPPPPPSSSTLALTTVYIKAELQIQMALTCAMKTIVEKVGGRFGGGGVCLRKGKGKG